VAETEKENRKKDKVRNKNEKKNFTIPRSDLLSLSLSQSQNWKRMLGT